MRFLIVGAGALGGYYGGWKRRRDHRGGRSVGLSASLRALPLCPGDACYDETSKSGMG